MKKIIPLVIASTSMLFACNTEENTATNNNASPVTAVAVSKEDAIANVNGTYISKTSLAQLEKEINQRSPNHAFPKEKLVEELIQRELLIQDAINKQLDKSAEFTERLETIKKSLLSQASIQNFLKSNPITDADLEAEYNKNADKAGTEYKARHILVKTEDEAKQIISELSKGADFIELAKTKSTGPSGPQGGDLGWFTATQMVAPFSEATIALEDNKFTTDPVQTQFGWHIILREGSRAQTPPPLASVKEQIRPLIQRQKMQEFMDTLRKQAKVEILLPTETDLKEPVTVDSTSATDPAASKSEEVKTTEEKTATEPAKPITKDVVDTVTKTTEKIETAGETAAKEAATIASETIEEIKKVVTETEATAKEAASETATKALESVTP